jgi:uncharacterized protein involved in oxidation of intracellular sulfur
MLKTFARPRRPDCLLRHMPGRSRIGQEHLIDEAPRSTMDELAAWTVEADQVLVF